MSSTSITGLRQQHDNLFQEVSLLSSAILKSPEIQQSPATLELKNTINKFLDEIVDASKRVSLREDYSWLSETLAKWQLTYSRVFNEEKQLELCIPEKIMITPPIATTMLSENEIVIRIEKHSDNIWWHKIQEHKTDNDPIADWRNGEVRFSWEVIKGEVRFDKIISSNSYYRFENIWLTQVKELVSHFKYLAKRPYLIGNKSTHEEDYQAACDELRKMLVDKTRKADKNTFLEVKAYIENRYLSEGRFDESKPEAKQLLIKKSERIGERIRAKGGWDNQDENWYDAMAYSKLFYENIIPAVIDSRSESVLAIIKAFQFTKTVVDIVDKLHVIDVFEVILAIYYLDDTTILSLWEEGEKNLKEPYSAISSFVKIDESPSWLKKGKEIGLDLYPINSELWLRGIIFDRQYEILNKFCDSEKDKKILYNLYQESRLVKEHSTL
ncbi:MAG: hypothetical protein WCG16_10080 [Methylococcales bacterium]